MDRRQYVKACGGVAGAAVGLVGLHESVSGTRIRAIPSRTDVTEDEPSERPEQKERPARTFDPRDGRTLIGTSPPSVDDGHFDAFEAWQDGPSAVVTLFADVGQPTAAIEAFVHGMLTYVWERGSVPNVVWQPYFVSREATPPTVEADVAGGRYDDPLDDWTSALTRWLRPDEGPDRRLYLTFAPEMNGDWVPWDASDGESTSEDYVAMWRTVYDRVSADLTPDHLRWVWSVNNGSRWNWADEPVGIDRYYPGDAYVDWVGVHGYNWDAWGGWKQPDGVYDAMVENVREVSDKPLAFTECACSSRYGDGYRPDLKDEWITAFFAYVDERDVRMVCWFDKEKETDWAVFGGSRGTETVEFDGTSVPAYEAYRTAASESGILLAYPDHPRVLTDAEFAGSF
ncbi:glycoside hydrolase family 26 protein [Halomarina ordinaria]|uniref:Glycoside hydrolase family 26 protein n=1 Tax=Halomarina ordinaria TaxID=3033939 RepID=A0ABD5U878_9EURY|nr:glycosyl hydrolase [Halomarina sp. PSRA2]